MTGAPSVSVIVPAYNAEKYILNLIDSILAQTMQDFELLIIDDGSTDQTPVLCQDAAQKDKRIIVITQDNGGPSAARNNGLEKARGRYVTFADADDICGTQWLEKMRSALESHQCEMAMCNWVEMQEGNIIPCSTFPAEDRLIEAEQFVPVLTGLGGSVWNKLFLRKIIEQEHLRFDIHKKRSEDFMFVVEYLCYVHHVALVSQPLYQYRVIQGSLSHIDSKSTLYQEICEGQRDALQIISSKANEKLYKKLVSYVIDSHIGYATLMIKYKATKGSIQKLVRCVSAYYGQMNLKQRIYFLTMNVSPVLFELSWRALTSLKQLSGK